MGQQPITAISKSTMTLIHGSFSRDGIRIKREETARSVKILHMGQALPAFFWHWFCGDDDIFLCTFQVANDSVQSKY